jgi:hypothetical protein
LYTLANRVGIRRGELPSTFITRVDLENVAEISGFRIVRQRQVGYCPWRLFGIGDLVNRLMPALPMLRWFALTDVAVLRPIVPKTPTGISCVIPARNERGNIENALKRMPDLGCPIEVIFVEGHSTDDTWAEILRVVELYRGQFRIQALQQTGKGKADAVRLGFAHATEPLLTILDADLTMPPEMLGRFFRAYCEGRRQHQHQPVPAWISVVENDSDRIPPDQTGIYSAWTLSIAPTGSPRSVPSSMLSRR